VVLYRLADPRLAAAVGAALLVVVVIGAIFVEGHPSPFGIDLVWADAMKGMRRPVLTFVAEHIFDPLGRFPISWSIVGVAAIALSRARRRRAIAVLLIGELASWMTSSLIKTVVERPRPPMALVEASRSSFPSGHSAFAAVTAVLLVGLLVPSGRRAIPAAFATALALAMAWSRTYLLAHWLTDVIAGLCVGTGVGLLTLAFAGTAPTEGTDRASASALGLRR
jgi:membrane-associated phospholipid phosphatase